MIVAQPFSLFSFSAFTLPLTPNQALHLPQIPSILLSCCSLGSFSSNSVSTAANTCILSHTFPSQTKSNSLGFYAFFLFTHKMISYKKSLQTRFMDATKVVVGVKQELNYSMEATSVKKESITEVSFYLQSEDSLQKFARSFSNVNGMIYVKLSAEFLHSSALFWKNYCFVILRKLGFDFLEIKEFVLKRFNFMGLIYTSSVPLNSSHFLFMKVPPILYIS